MAHDVPLRSPPLLLRAACRLEGVRCFLASHRCGLSFPDSFQSERRLCCLLQLFRWAPLPCINSSSRSEVCVCMQKPAVGWRAHSCLYLLPMRMVYSHMLLTPSVLLCSRHLQRFGQLASVTQSPCGGSRAASCASACMPSPQCTLPRPPARAAGLELPPDWRVRQALRLRHASWLRN